MKRGISDVIQTEGVHFFAPQLYHDGEARWASRVGALDHLLVPAWARERSREENNYIRYHRGICHIMHRPNLTYYSVRSTNEGNTIQPERRVHVDPGPLICHRTVGCRDRHGEDFKFKFISFLFYKNKKRRYGPCINSYPN